MNKQQLATELEVDVHETVDLACTAKLTKTYQNVRNYEGFLDGGFC